MAGLPLLKRAAVTLGAGALAGMGLLATAGTAHAEGPAIKCRDAAPDDEDRVFGSDCSVYQADFESGPATIQSDSTGRKWQCSATQLYYTGVVEQSVAATGCKAI